MPNDAAASASSAAPAGEGVLSAEEVARQRKLKGIVIGLGLLILLAFAGVVFGMVYRASRIGKGPIPSAAVPVGPAQINTSAAALMPEIKLSLPRGNEVKAASLQGNRLLVHHEGPAGGGFIVIDLATGGVVSRITVERDR